MHKFLTVALLVLSELRAAYSEDGSPYTVAQIAYGQELPTVAQIAYRQEFPTVAQIAHGRKFPTVAQIAHGQKFPTKFPWTVLVKTPLKKCVGTIVRGQDKHETPLVLTPAECLLRPDIRKSETRMEIPSMVLVVGRNYSSVAKNLYISSQGPESSMAFIKLEVPYRGPAVKVNGTVASDKVKKCVLVRFSHEEVQRRQKLSDGGWPITYRAKEEICSNNTAPVQDVLDGQALICKDQSDLWTVHGVCSTQKTGKVFKSAYLPIGPVVKAITSAARRMELYKKDEVFFNVRKLAYQKMLLGGIERWTLTEPGRVKIYYRDSPL